MSDIAALLTWTNIRFLLEGLGLTLIISALAIACSIVLGAVISIMRGSSSRLLRGFAIAYVELFKNTPLLLLIMFTFFVAQLPPLPAAVLAFTLFSAASVAEIVRGGVASVPAGQYEAARSQGFSAPPKYLYIILPQALRNIVPQNGNNFIINIKDTSVLSVISITDLFFVHKSVVGALYTYFESAAIVMVIYLTMPLFASYLLRLWEKSLDGPQNYDLNTTDSLAYTSGMYNAPDPDHKSQNLDMKGGAAHV